MNIRTETEDAIFQDKQKKVANALVVIPRHPLMKDRPIEHIQEKIEEYKLDLELGLKGQVANTEKHIVDKDIEEVMRGEKYYPITLKQLEKLFNFPKLKWKNYWFNYLKYWGKKPMTMIFTHLLLAIPVVVTFLTVFVNAYFATCYLLCMLDIFLYICFSELNEVSTVKLEMSAEDVKRTNLNIPMGAKLRLKEAIERKLFDKFIIVFPNIVKKYNVKYDPAIIGVTDIGNEEKWWMITYWDVEKNKEKTNSQIEHFKRLKLRSYE